MKTFDEMEYHPASEKLVQILCDKTQNSNPLFFQVIVAYSWCKIAAMMRATIATHDRGDIPVNMYTLALSPSGTGKGVSTGLLENEVAHLFRKRFLEETFPVLAEANLPKISLKRAVRKGTDPDDELMKTTKEFEDLGSLVFDFSEATTPAVKQLRHKMLMANAGAVNLEIDEIGSTLVGSQEVFPTFLELFDMGRTKSKLTKASADNKRNEEIHGGTPTNLLMFGEPIRLLDGGKVEEALYGLLETGYARRSFFAYNRFTNSHTDITPEELYNLRTKADTHTFIEGLADQLEGLADIVNANKSLSISKNTHLLLNEYELQCSRRAALLGNHEELKKKELSHRHFKSLKLAGAYAFIDDSPEVTEQHLYYAIKLAEASGDAFMSLLSRDRPYVKLAKYISVIGRDVTQADMVEDLPFYKGSQSQRGEMLTLATAWGYKNNILIKKSFEDGIEFLRGESLKPTNLEEMVVAWSTDITENYTPELAPFDKLHKLTQQPGLHWVNHHLVNGYRNEENAIPGFSMVVVDVDGGVNMSTAKLLLRNYKFLMYTTKRHTPDEHRFRIVLPINFELKMDAKDFKELMNNIFDWLPFEVDRTTGQRSRKWLSHDGQYEYNEGEVFDILPFIPKTSKNEVRKQLLDSQQSLDNLERWVMNHIGDGNRNNMLHRYGRILIDAGFSFDAIKDRVYALNSKIPDKLDEAELLGTVMTTVSRELIKRA